MSLKDLIADVNINEIYEHIETETLSEWVNAWQKAALTALRPVSREQLERMFPGCTYCKPDSEGYVQKFGAYSILNGELETGHCKPQRINFCPHCSRPLTDEAMEMVMERLEALKDGKGD